MRRAIEVRVPGVPLAVPADTIAPEGEPRFYVVRGIPVSVGAVADCPYQCAQWASRLPEPFSEAAVRDHGKPVSEAQWRDLVLACRLGW